MEKKMEASMKEKLMDNEIETRAIYLSALSARKQKDGLPARSARTFCLAGWIVSEVCS